jgi:3-oxoacyl-[acyl-carrier protein] reductase
MTMPRELEDYRVVITGAAGGLGSAAARQFAAEGARVVVSDRDGDAAAALARLIDPEGRRAHDVRCDIGDAQACDALVDAAEAFFGGPIDVFLANAGVGYAGSLVETEVAEIDRVMSINVLGTIYCARAALRSLARSPRASLLFTCSLQGVTARPRRSLYTASKHAILGLTKALALDYGPLGVRVNAIAPAATDTPFLQAQLKQDTDDVGAALDRVAAALPLGRLPTGQDFADAACFLASPRARSISGHNLLLDCGASAGMFVRPVASTPR